MSGMARLHEWDSWAEWEPTNNDLGPTEPGPYDYRNWWSSGEWVDTAPDMRGYVCSAGVKHEPYFRVPPPTPPVGLAGITDLPAGPARLPAP